MTDPKIEEIKRNLEKIDLHVDRLIAIKEAYENINERAQDATDYCQKYLLVKAWGRNIWHAVLDDAIRMRKVMEDEIESLDRKATAEKRDYHAGKRDETSS